MSASNDFETDLLEKIFHDVDLPGLGSGDADVFIALHTADPGEGGTQATSEAAYAGYARQAVSRIVGNWQVLGSNVANVNEIAFPQATGGSETLTHFSIGRTGGGIIVSGALTSSLAVSTGVTPKFAAGALVASAN